ncbi:MAG: TerB family tellurite resistance protein [Longimicrobiales bacterium]
MLESIRSFFEQRMDLPGKGNGAGNGNGAGSPEAASSSQDEASLKRLHVAACALLLELAHADEEFSASERLHIEAVMRRHFDLDEATAQELMALAEKEQSEAIDLFQFTSLIRENYDLGQKTLLAEIMWGLILADGEIAKREAYMLRKIANLLDLEPGYLSAARKRAGREDG